MRLLKKDVSFYWEDVVQRSFVALKHALTTAPLLQPTITRIYYYIWLQQSQPLAWS
jgi:hypothetical protein